MTITMERPPKWDYAMPDGVRLPDEAWEAFVDDAWSTEPRFVAGRLCRWGSPRNGYCKAPAVAVLFRGGRRHPWAYCENHLFGRWIENGQVMDWRVRAGY